MLGNGLREVSNPSEILISHKNEVSGTAIASTLEGMRPLDDRNSSTVSTAVYGTPQRSTGLQCQRLNMILAVLEKELVLGLAPRCFPKHNGWHFGR
jgi:DNA repair protein RadA/Sms